MDSKAEPTFSDFLSLLKLDRREVAILSALYSHGELTVVEISRQVDISRATIYRILEELQNKELVDEVVEEYVRKFQLAPFPRFEYLLSQKYAELEHAQSLYKDLKKQKKQESQENPDTKVLMYRGRNGIRQMVWNVLSATSEIIGYSYQDLDQFVGPGFMQRWRDEFIIRKKSGRDIVTRAYLNSLKKTNREEKAEILSFWKTRFMPPTGFKIDHQLDVYDDIVAIYNWHEGEVFGVEIQNKNVASLQRQLFEVMWKMGKELV